MAAAAPLHPVLPDEIFIWEILLRLPPKDLLRCRGVCRPWRHATSSREFLLVHHGRQPSLPLLYERNSTGDGGGYLDIIAAADQLHPVARLGTSGAFTRIVASCDGILILCTSDGEDSSISDFAYYSVCNPATRQYAPLPQLRGFCVAGMYPHPPTGEYRLLLYLDPEFVGDLPELPGAEYDCYVYTLGSCEPLRDAGSPKEDEGAEALLTVQPVLFCGGLHWFIERDERESRMILVFDTIAELFRWMRAPAVPGFAQLFEMDGMLGMASYNDAIDIWMTQDYDREVWAFRYRVQLNVAELTVRFGHVKYSELVVSSRDDDDVLILVQCGKWLLQIGTDCKLVANFHRELLDTTQFRLKQTLVPHTFFPTIEGYVVNTWPFISSNDRVVNT